MTTATNRIISIDSEILQGFMTDMANTRRDYQNLTERVNQLTIEKFALRADLTSQGNEISRLRNKSQQNREVIVRAIKALDASLDSSLTTCKVVCGVGLAIAGGAIGMLAAPLAGVAIPAIAATEGAGVVVGTAGGVIGAAGGGSGGVMGLAPAIHGALCKDKIKERNDLNQYLTNLPEHAPREIRDLITDLDQIRN